MCQIVELNLILDKYITIGLMRDQFEIQQINYPLSFLKLFFDFFARNFNDIYFINL